MAKKIRIDFSKTEERSGWNTSHIDEGLHKMTIVGLQETNAQDGTDMLVYALVPVEAKLKTRKFPYYCKLQQNQFWKLRDLLVAAGETVPKKALQIDPGKVIGRVVAADVVDDEYQGTLRSTISGVYALSVLDDDEEPEEDEELDDDEELEEPDDEELDDDEEDEELDEDEGDERAEELEGLSLPALRKEAKGLGIDTAGLKKAELIEAILEAEAEADEDEDDLDDIENVEEGEDEEEEEEEEPKPAPRRTARAASAPVKRTVRRR